MLFKQLIHLHLAVQLGCTESLKLYFRLMKMHLGLDRRGPILHKKWFDPVAVPVPDKVRA